MLALVKFAFMGRPDSEPMARRITPGETITGALAQVAVATGNAEPVEDQGAGALATKPARKARAK